MITKCRKTPDRREEASSPAKRSSPPVEHPGLRDLLNELLSRDGSFTDYKIEHEFAGMGWKRIMMNASPIIQKGRRAETILLAMEDITAR